MLPLSIIKTKTLRDLKDEKEKYRNHNLRMVKYLSKLIDIKGFQHTLHPHPKYESHKFGDGNRTHVIIDKEFEILFPESEGIYNDPDHVVIPLKAYLDYFKIVNMNPGFTPTGPRIFR